MLRVLPAFVLLALGAVLGSGPAAVADEPIKEAWDYAPAMTRLIAANRGKPGVVLHIGDSITYANPYGQYARNGAGKTPAQQSVLDWMHTNANNETDGWWLCRFDHPNGGRSYTSAGGLRADELLNGGKAGLPPLRELLSQYQPQMVVVLLGTNDCSAERKVDAYLADMKKVVEQISAKNAICILTTIPPNIQKPDLAKSYNEGLRALAKLKQIPLIDYEAEILKRRPNDWDGTLMLKGDVHPSANVEKVTPASAPTEENLKQSGYLLRGWLTVDKLREVKERTFPSAAPVDNVPSSPAAPVIKAQARPGPKKIPMGEVVKVPISRDTWLCSVGDQANNSTGGAPRLKLKSNQEFTLVDIDTKPLRGRKILGATLFVKVAGAEVLHRVTVSSVASEWVEGTAETYEAQQGSSTFNARLHPSTPWAFPGSDLTSVVLGNGNTWWWMAEAFPPAAGGWQKISVEPALIAARVAGISQGFLLFDDTGTEWNRGGDKFTVKPMPNRYIHSRESGAANAPYLEITLGPADTTPPAACGELRVEPTTADLPGGEAHISWITPADQGGTGTIGFLVDIEGTAQPQWSVPMAGPPGQRVMMHLRDLKLSPGAAANVRVRPVDGAGNIGTATAFRAATSKLVVNVMPGSTPDLMRTGDRLPKLAGAEVAIIDALDKVAPVTGTMIPQQPLSYLMGNHLWSAREPMIQLHAARNEFIDFQILFKGLVDNVRAELSFKTLQPNVTILKYHHVPTTNGPLPDPIVRHEGGFGIPDATTPIKGQQHGSLYSEIYVPKLAPAGIHRGTLKLTAEGGSLEIPVNLTVWDFTLPDTLSFLPEMNCYSLPENEREYYRLAHIHRTVLNRVPYSQRGEIDAGCAPVWDGKTLEFRSWDNRFGPYFDGTAFDDLPRKGVPIECFYLPLHENWPTSIDSSYSGGYWADEAFTPEYRAAFTSAVEQFAAHIGQMGWKKTVFQAFLNNKYDYKERGWSRGSSPWLLDEPSSFQDYWALRYFGEAFNAGLSASYRPIVFRADISRPQWQRDSLDGVLDYNVVANSPFREYHRLVMDRKQRLGQYVVEYGSSNEIGQSNVQPAAWCVDSWMEGSDGVVPWQTVGKTTSWNEADATALFYPAGFVAQELPVPSIRLKAYRRGQQDVEYLTLLSHLLKQPRWMTAQQARDVVQLTAKVRATGAPVREDAGRVDFTQLKPHQLWTLRVQIGDILSKRRADSLPPLPDWHPKPQNRVTQGGYVTVGEVPPNYISAAPEPAAPKPAKRP